MTKKIIFCKCGGERIDDERLRSLENKLHQLPVDLIVLNDLCGLAALNKDVVGSLFNDNSVYMLIGCYPRSMKLLLERADAKIKGIEIKYINCIGLDNDKIISEAEAFCPDSDHVQLFQEITASGNWPSWYPVIDYKLCSACGQCADFCLFGVYDKNKNGVQVVNPHGCKNNCPACARICPQTAIVFPKYIQGGAIGGSELTDDIEEQKRQTKDIGEILGGNIYDALEQRKRKRHSIILNEAMIKAQQERENALKGKNNIRK